MMQRRTILVIAAASCYSLFNHVIVVGAFVLPSNGGRNRRLIASPQQIAAVASSPGGSDDSPLRNIVSRLQQQKQQLQEEIMEPPPPKLFSDDLLEDMQQVLLSLERRVKQGPGILTDVEVHEFSTRTQRILVEMKGTSQQNQQHGTIGSSPQMSAPATFPSLSSTAAAPQPVPPKKTISSSSPLPSSSSLSDVEDGPDYTPDGGFGSLARGTANTYVIPGMDAMTAEEYQQALQQSIIERQSRRKSSGAYGNLAAHDYLNQLGSKPGMLK